MQTLLAAESDAICKRNVSMFWVYHVMDKAVEWIFSAYDTIGSLDEGLQMSVIVVIRADCMNDLAHQVRLLLTFPYKIVH
jgi:coatomer subunit beta